MDMCDSIQENRLVSEKINYCVCVEIIVRMNMLMEIEKKKRILLKDEKSEGFNLDGSIFARHKRKQLKKNFVFLTNWSVFPIWSYIYTHTPTSQIWTPKMQAPPSTGQPSKDILLIKCLELGVVIGVAMACCSVFYAFLIYGHFPLTGTLWSQGAQIREVRCTYICLQNHIWHPQEAEAPSQ